MRAFLLTIVVLLHWLFVYPGYISDRNQYEQDRKQIVDDEEALQAGNDFNLSSKEADVDRIFMGFKEKELTRGFRHEDQHTAALHFFKAKKMIEKGDVFPFLKMMPKGALLHVHDAAAVSSKWVIKNLTYMPGMLRISEERDYAWYTSIYDDGLEKSINLRAAYPEMVFPTLKDVWDKFQNMFGTMGDVFSYLPAFQRYIWQMLTELYLDNVMYAEIRSSLKELYDEKGKVYSKDFTTRLYINISKKFVKEYPDFLGIKIIYGGRRSDITTIKQSIKEFIQLNKDFPEFVIGYDLVGQEDKGMPLHSVLDALDELPEATRLYFHAGETNWFGSLMDANLLDAILLKTKRIGHGYALAKHPTLMQMVKTNSIGLEISPISNQVLNLVWDMRNHPAAMYLAEDIPMSITNDDPGFWDAEGLSYDFYYAIMSMAPNSAGLSLLKALVWHSIDYSTLSSAEKEKGLSILNRRWEKFLTEGYINNREQYEKERKQIMDDEEALQAGADFNLTSKEAEVNRIFMGFKDKELTRGLRHEDQHTAALHFFKAKSMIEKGDVFLFLKMMPKGALLHVHDTAAVSSKWVIKNLTYMPGMLRCHEKQARLFEFIL
nr:adenosine deaminase 2-like [Drosophila bipectinata]